MHQLTLLTEILGTKSLPGSLDLVSALLDTLNKLIQSSSGSQADANYVEQMLMSAIDNAATNIPVRSNLYVVLLAYSKCLQESPNVTPSVIRVDVLVEIIRGNISSFL